MRKFLRLAISILFLGYGLIRIGVGSALYAQVAGLIDFQVVPQFEKPDA